jgi:hypothetical protein
MDLSIKFNEEKNQLLKSTIGIGFDEILIFIQNGNVLDDLKHPAAERSNQRLYLIKIEEHVYVVPYVIDKSKHEIFLKTIYPSRKYTNLYWKGEKT